MTTSVIIMSHYKRDGEKTKPNQKREIFSPGIDCARESKRARDKLASRLIGHRVLVPKSGSSSSIACDIGWRDDGRHRNATEQTQVSRATFDW